MNKRNSISGGSRPIAPWQESVVCDRGGEGGSVGRPRALPSPSLNSRPFPSRPFPLRPSASRPLASPVPASRPFPSRLPFSGPLRAPEDGSKSSEPGGGPTFVDLRNGSESSSSESGYLRGGWDSESSGLLYDGGPTFGDALRAYFNDSDPSGPK